MNWSDTSFRQVSVEKPQRIFLLLHSVYCCNLYDVVLANDRTWEPSASQSSQSAKYTLLVEVILVLTIDFESEDTSFYIASGTELQFEKCNEQFKMLVHRLTCDGWNLTKYFLRSKENLTLIRHIVFETWLKLMPYTTNMLCWLARLPQTYFLAMMTVIVSTVKWSVTSNRDM